jgi:hypothetical protein
MCSSDQNERLREISNLVGRVEIVKQTSCSGKERRSDPVAVKNSSKVQKFSGRKTFHV